MKIGSGEVRGLSSFISNFNAAYKVEALTFPTPNAWPTNPINIQKRQVACGASPIAVQTGTGTAQSSASGSRVAYQGGMYNPQPGETPDELY